MVTTLRDIAERPNLIVDTAIQIWRSNCQATVIVEGTSDVKFFETFFNPKVVRVVSVDGKPKVLELYQTYRATKFDAARFVADIDFDFCRGIKRPIDVAIAYIAGDPKKKIHYANDLECLLLRSGALERLCREYPSQLSADDLLGRLLLAGTRLGVFRLATWEILEKEERELVLFDVEKLVEAENLVVKKDAFDRALGSVSASKRRSIIEKVERVSVSDDVDPWAYCRGHDLTGLLASHFGCKTSFRLVREEIERSLRLAAQWHQIRSTPLGEMISDWKTPAAGPVPSKPYLRPEFRSN